MSQSKTQIQSLLSGAGMAPQHRFGQNFMVDQNLVKLIARTGEVGPDDHVIEVGPGTGTLTGELLTHAGRLIAVEIDRGLAALLAEQFGEDPRFELRIGDALSGKHALNPFLQQCIIKRKAAGQTVKLVANLPYNIASPLVIEMLIAGVDLLVFTVQKEVADRLRATAGTETYGPLSVMVQLLGQVQVIRTLPPQAFWPPPKIDSALVRIERADQLGDDARALGVFVHQLFSTRRKTLRKALTLMNLPSEALLTQVGLNAQDRPEVLTPQQFFALWQAARRVQSPAVS